MKSDYKVGWKGLMTGRYVRHWEVGRFVWENSVVKREKWGNPGNCCEIVNLNEMKVEDSTEKISFNGEIVAIGSFGHMGTKMFRIRFISYPSAA